MHEQLKVYEEKMQKTMKSLDSDLADIFTAVTENRLSETEMK